MAPFLIRRLTLLALLAAMVGGATTYVSAQDDDDIPRIKRKKAPPPADDDGVPPKYKKARSLEGLLRQSGLKYEVIDRDAGPMYKIPLTIRDQRTTAFAWEVKMGQDKAGEDITAVIVGTPVFSFSQGEKPPTALYKVVCDYNERIVFGRGMVGKGGVGFGSAFWLRTADTQTLLDHLFLAHVSRVELKKQVQSILEE